MPYLFYYPKLAGYVGLISLVNDHAFVKDLQCYFLVRRQVNRFLDSRKGPFADGPTQLKGANYFFLPSFLSLLRSHVFIINNNEDKVIVFYNLVGKQ